MFVSCVHGLVKTWRAREAFVYEHNCSIGDTGVVLAWCLLVCHVCLFTCYVVICISALQVSQYLDMMKIPKFPNSHLISLASSQL